jgi:hypothetical protein
MTEDTHLENIRAIAELKTQLANVADDVSTVVKKMEVVWSMQNQMTSLQQDQINNKDSLRRLFVRIENSETTALRLKERTEKWINMGIGAWFVFAVMAGFINWLVIDRVRGYEGKQERQGDNLTTLDRRMSWAEYELKMKAKKEAQQ